MTSDDFQCLDLPRPRHLTARRGLRSSPNQPSLSSFGPLLENAPRRGATADEGLLIVLPSSHRPPTNALKPLSKASHLIGISS